MAEELKRKMQGEAPSASDEIQKQLSVLLDIEWYFFMFLCVLSCQIVYKIL